MAEIDTGKIAYCKIYPGVGIARLGNSPDEFFIGPETPGEPASPIGGFKDDACRIKRQAARFRLYAFDKDNGCIGEVTAGEGIDITWTVHLANAKASYNTFLGRFWQSQFPNFNKYNPNETPLRNQEIMDPQQRLKLLVIDPGERSIKPGDGPVEFDTGTIGPLPYSDIPIPSGTDPDPLFGSRDGWWNCLTNDQLLPPVKMSAKETVPLGTLRVDESGRLLVLGGYGHTDTLIPNNPIGRLMENNYYANNDYWFDDTSDGPVSAQLKIGGKAIEVRDTAWVLVTPPKFAPASESITTLYDTAMETWEKKANGKLPPRPVSFTRDIYPILKRLDHFQWLNHTVYQHHGANTNFDFGDVHSPLFDLLHTKLPGSEEQARQARDHIFKRLRPPGLVPATADAHDTPETAKWASYRFMPQMSGDGGEPVTPQDPLTSTANPTGTPYDKVFDCTTGAQWPVTVPTTALGGCYVTWLTLSDRQYGDITLWAQGQFDDDWKGPPQPVPLESMPVADQPEALNRAAFEPCVGAPFYPGIEITFIATEPALWSGPCRIDAANTPPGGVTRHMALPWQSDFAECNTNWWPSARPDDVVSEANLHAVLTNYDASTEGGLARALSVRVPWARGIPAQSPMLDNAMVTAWSHFGFVVKRDVGNGQTVYVETERSPYFGSTERDFFYYLMNIDSYPDFLPRARQLVHQYLDQGRQNMSESDADEVFGLFPYSQAAFDSRMELIYANFVRDNQTTADPKMLASGQFLPADYLVKKNREKMAYAQLQYGPFNQLDGAWLRRAVPDGPVDEVGELLARIRQDELGDGVASQNHANVYTDLLKSLHFYLPDLYTRAYADDPRLLDEAFTQPCFLLAISQFDDDYLPEILGMTLYLEWSSIALISTVATLEAFGINPLYYQLHVGIDNAAQGHGAVAKRAVEIFLDRVRTIEGEAAMQKAWERIWTGYVTFATLGNLGDAITAHFKNNKLSDRVQALITRKAPYASQTHGEKTLGNAAINDWFLDPAGMMAELQKAGLIVPGRPEISPFFELLSFRGPMFHVFSADEEQLLRDWCVSLAVSDKPAISIQEGMNYVIDTLRQRQVGEPGHNVRLTGPDPDSRKKGGKRTEPLHWWFEQGNRALMSALADPDNGWIVPFDSIASPISSSMLAGNGDMANDFRSIVPDSDGLTCGNVFAQWIDAGCPLDEVKTQMLMLRKPRETPWQPVHRMYRRADGKIWGMGTPH
jgi:hypothetical protein